MCFSNLPIEFDDQGNPYLAEEADEVDHRPERRGRGVSDGDDVAIGEADPEELYETILATVPESVRDRVADGPDDHGRQDHQKSAEGD